MQIKVITDSTSYIPHRMREELDISVISLGIHFESETHKEEEIDNDTFYEKMAQSHNIPTSSQPTLNDICLEFEKQVMAQKAVVGIFISSDMSGTYSTALMAKKMVIEKYPDAVIEIIDSRSNSMEMGLAVVAAARAAKKGMSVREVADQAKAVIASSRFLFVPETLRYLRKGGRIGGAAALLGSVLQIKPILTVHEGKTEVYDKIRTKARALRKIVDTCLEDIEKMGLGEVVVHHINSKTEGLKLAQMIESKLNIKIPVISIGPVIGLHVGPGTIGVAYYTKNS